MYKVGINYKYLLCKYIYGSVIKPTINKFIIINQLEKLRKDIGGAARGGVAIKIRVKKMNRDDAVTSRQHTLLLTRNQIKGIENARRNGHR